ncbi:MAG: DUF4089 domain-containing protein [Gammaproteobacteria bacterium]|jgi:hypothetical protein|nr:DUF4089 domain-containing protein [Gammaproteobacteria bacterium]MBU0785985.1 DUF4089 domain-containing protein [Gammaproteobacteria bacterium]MBU0816598.1 DUF4089 domain-containing protein [Gammaproteobacteria bacterium]MBU1788399.1 DUF4089 domain-containing protein [Gammaproteobacteria bacterium]
MEEQEVLAYVRATTRALQLSLDEARTQAVALHLGRTTALAQMLEAVQLLPEIEPAEVYRPAPFPSQEASP